MGSRMATNLVKAGHDVVLYDADQAKSKALATTTGATAAVSLQDVATSCASIFTMLPNAPHVESVYMGEGNEEPVSPEVEVGRSAGGLVDLATKGTLLVDSSTIDPLVSRKINAAAADKGIVMIDAPVSGGVQAAAQGTLTFIVGGTKEGEARARPLLEAMGKSILHCGDSGAGGIAKLCNNLCLAVSMIGVSEAMSLGSKMGMDPKTLAGIMNASSARCWSSDCYNPHPGVMENVPSSNGYAGGFATVLMEKDLYLALQAGRANSQSLPMGALAHQLYSLTGNLGNSRKDFSSIHELIAGVMALQNPQENPASR